MLCTEALVPSINPPASPRKQKKPPKWFLYRLSRYIPMEAYPVSKPEKRREAVVKARRAIDLTKLRGKVSRMKLHGITAVRGPMQKAQVERIEVRETKMLPDLWKLIASAEEVYLDNVEIEGYPLDALKSASSLDLLGTTAIRIKESIEELLQKRRRRIRVASRDFVVLWDEYKGCICAVHSYNPVAPLKALPFIRTLHLINVEITESVIAQMKRHPISHLRIEKCWFQQTVLFDMVSACRSTLKQIEFQEVSLAPCLMLYLKSLSIQVDILGR